MKRILVAKALIRRNNIGHPRRARNLIMPCKHFRGSLQWNQVSDAGEVRNAYYPGLSLHLGTQPVRILVDDP